MTARKSWLPAAVLGIWAIVGAGGAGGQPAPPQGQAAPSAPASPAPAQTSWHTVTGPERSFTADMPAAPIYSTRDVRTAAGSSYTLHQYLLEQGDVAYVVHTAVYPDEVTVRNPRANLQGGLDEAAKTMDGGKWASIDWKTRERLTAVDAVGARGSHAIRAYSVMKGRQIFTLTYLGPPGSVQSPEVERFLGSLRIGP
jgi:hypothetical protein